MKKLLCLLLTCFTSANVLAADRAHFFSLKEAFESPAYEGRLDPGIKFYFGKTPTPSIEQSFSEGITNRKTNAFNKSDKFACEWALLSALLSLQEFARSHGANAIVGIESYYKANAYSSETQYECHTGAIIAGVALKGTAVKLAE